MTSVSSPFSHHCGVFVLFRLRTARMRAIVFGHLELKVTLLVLCLLVSSCGYKPMVSTFPGTAANPVAKYAININTASADDLQRIPHIGEKLAAKIIEHREINGPFRRVEHLMLIQGISDKRFRKIRPLVRVE